MNWYPRVLLIGPGAIKGFKVLGFLSTLEDEELLNRVDTYCGVSVGAIISLLLVAGYTVREIVNQASSVDLFKDMETLSVKNIIEKKGVLSTEHIRRKLNDCILEKFGNIPTLSNLYMRTGKSLITVTLNASDDQCVMMSPTSHPNVSCVDATLFSMNIPFVFYQLIYQGKTYVDGALGNPYPIDYFDDNRTNILGIYMKTKHNIDINVSRSDTDTNNNIAQLSSYILKTIESLINHRRNHIIQLSSDKCRHVCLETDVTDSLGFKVSTAQKALMLVEGFNEGRIFINSLSQGANNYLGKKDIPKYTYPEYLIDNNTQ